MSIADRALAAYESEQEQNRIQAELKEEATRGAALVTIMAAIERLGLELDDRTLERHGSVWRLEVQVDDDATLLFDVTDSGGLTMMVKPTDQLYWDLPPGQDKKLPGGGTYACYGLNRDFLTVTTLADLGRQILKVRKAREHWRAKHETR